jgi:cysteine-rich repeat protein
MPLDAPLPKKDLELIRTWIADPELLPPVCSDPDPPLELCGAGRGAGAQCDPSQFHGYACDNFDVRQCDDWSFGDFTHHCPHGCVGVPRELPGFGDDLEKNWCEATCGDNKVEGPEECDGNPAPDGFPCSSRCTYCGNGVVYGIEECDDGNNDDGDGCSHLCESECGDKMIEGAEQCDDGNRKNGDGCSSTCQKE